MAVVWDLAFWEAFGPFILCLTMPLWMCLPELFTSGWVKSAIRGLVKFGVKAMTDVIQKCLDMFPVEGVGPETEKHIEASLVGLRNLYPGICFEWSVAYGLHVGVPPDRDFDNQQIANAADFVVALNENLEAIGLHPMSVHMQGLSFLKGTRFFTELSRVLPRSKPLFQQLVDDDDE